MRLTGISVLVTTIAVMGGAGCRTTTSVGPGAARPEAASLPVAGVWDGVLRETISDGMGAGDTRIEKQEWHLDQRGGQISGYYLAALTFVSGDGRPYVCSRQPRFSALIRFDVSGRVNGQAIELDEVAQRPAAGHCDPGARRLAHYRAAVTGDVMTLEGEGQRQTLYRNRGKPQSGDLVAEAAASGPAAEPSFPALREGPSLGAALGGAPSGGPAGNGPVSSISGPAAGAPAPTSSSSSAAAAADVSGTWIWEHQGAAPGGDEKQEREEWHLDQDGARISGYYDRVVRQISTDGHAYRCSLGLEFEIATRYRVRGEVRGNQVVLYENSFEVLAPNACDSGKRRLDAYEGLVNTDEIRLIWGVGGQILRRPRPDVPTQRF